MKAKKFNILLLGVLMGLTPVLTSAQNEVTKEYHEEYGTADYSKLILQNKYGSVDILNWDSPTIKIDVIVKVIHSNEDRAQKMLDQINVKFTTEGKSVKAVTVIEDRFKSNNGDNEFEINYAVQIPKDLDLELSNKYGHAFLDELSGHAQLEIKYGKLTVNKLTRGQVKPLNTVSLAYASGSSIGECSWLKANIKYSSLDIEKAKAFVGYTSYMKLKIEEASSVVIEGKYDDYNFGKLSNLVVNSSYSNITADELSKKLEADTRYTNGKIEYMKLKIEEASSVVIEGKYDDYNFGKLSNLVVNSSYSSITADELSKKLEADTRYTNGKIEYMPPTFESVNVESSYGGYKIGLDEKASFELDAETSYGKISYHDNGGKVSRIQESNKMQVYGRVGSNENPSATVKVRTKYAGVRLDY